MSNIIFFGTDIHGTPNELATKIVKRLKPFFKNSLILSLKDIQSKKFQKKSILINSPFRNKILRALWLSPLIPLYFLIFRFKYKKVAMFWTPSTKIYHSFLFIFLRFLGYEIYFTVISAYDKDYSSLIFCNKIVCQSKKMESFLMKNFNIPPEKIEVIYPGVDLNLFKPSKKKDIVLIPSVPHLVSTLKYRNIPKIVSLLKKEKIKSKIILRGFGIYEYILKQKIPNSKIINKWLSDKELSKEMADVKIVPLFYEGIVPDMPLSAIEALASGCAIICTKGMGITELVKEGKSGIVTNKIKISDFKKIFNNPEYNHNARKIAEKYFDLRIMIKKYKELFR